MEKIKVSAKTLDEAITKAQIQLNTTSDRMQYSVLAEGKNGLFGIGAKPWIIEAYRKEEQEELSAAQEIRAEFRGIAAAGGQDKTGPAKTLSEHGAEACGEAQAAAQEAPRAEAVKAAAQPEAEKPSGEAVEAVSGTGAQEQAAEEKPYGRRRPQGDRPRGGRYERRGAERRYGERRNASTEEAEARPERRYDGRRSVSAEEAEARPERRYDGRRNASAEESEVQTERRYEERRNVNAEGPEAQTGAGEEKPERPARTRRLAPVSEAEAAAAEQSAKAFIHSVMDGMGMEVQADAAFDFAENELALNLSGADMGILIGKRGQTLDSLQYLTSLVVNKNNREEYIRVRLDTENYRARRETTLRTLAKNIAYKVKRTRKTVALEPMNPYERRIIHAALQNDRYVTTRSEGEEPFRHVVVALKR